MIRFRTILVGQAILLSVAVEARAAPVAMLEALDRTIMLRTGMEGRTYGAGETDPLLWQGSRYFLSGESRTRLEAAVAAVGGLTLEEVGQCPLSQRILIQNRLWTLFDYEFDRLSAATYTHNQALSRENRNSLKELAGVIALLAADESELSQLPDPLLGAIQSQHWPAQPAAGTGPDAFLPDDLLAPTGGWVTLVREDGEAIAPGHLHGFGGRSLFCVKVRLPTGAGSAEKYFKTLADFPQPWIEDPSPSFPSPNGMPRFHLNPNLPTLPVGTQFALIRRLLAIDRQGRIRPTPLTLTVQVRFQHITQRANGRQSLADLSNHQRQSVAEFRLDTDTVAAGREPRFRAVGLNERDYRFFQNQGEDEIDGTSGGHQLDPHWNSEPKVTVLHDCYTCHGIGISAMNSLVGFRNPPFPLGPLIPELARTNLSEEMVAASWKSEQASWGALQALWPQ